MTNDDIRAVVAPHPADFGDPVDPDRLSREQQPEMGLHLSRWDRAMLATRPAALNVVGDGPPCPACGTRLISWASDPGCTISPDCTYGCPRCAQHWTGQP